MTTLPYYNHTYGTGFEGLVNYVNSTVDYMFVPVFLFVVWAIGIYGLSKSEWKLSNGFAYMSGACAVIAIVAKLFTQVPEFIIYFFIIMTAGGVVGGLMDKR